MMTMMTMVMTMVMMIIVFTSRFARVILALVPIFRDDHRKESDGDVGGDDDDSIDDLECNSTNWFPRTSDGYHADKRANDGEMMVMMVNSFSKTTTRYSSTWRV